MNKSLRIALFLSLCAALSGCGAKGPLILPEKAAPIEVPAETVPETPVPTDNTTTPADQQAEDAVDDPATPAEND
ncbi:LPS translocon maturation chaperone LptM [Pseudoxanthomonas sacheonensis]|uniref:Small lipoprotein YifL n=1 Tax=Pseudoxanthomonas sacheonensis TaxID=443615 RepID=A0ABU1RWM5_9GAMM|nr:lipoprotein [Pseudoxanthomonas sacheonensis]MDR6842715.1 putative small lipoprotein YifL [Pseudoxanthomonas sacheonensis]